MEKTIYKMNREAEALMKKTAADTNASETEFEAAGTAKGKKLKPLYNRVRLNWIISTSSANSCLKSNFFC